MRLLVRNSGLSHGSKLFYVTTETLVSDSVSRGLGRAQHSARESALIAGLGAGPGSNNPPLSASLPTLPIMLQETGGGNVTAAVSALGQCMNQGPSFLTSLLNPRLSSTPRPRLRLYHWLLFICGFITAFQRVFHSNYLSKFKGF